MKKLNFQFLIVPLWLFVLLSCSSPSASLSQANSDQSNGIYSQLTSSPAALTFTTLTETIPTRQISFPTQTPLKTSTVLPMLTATELSSLTPSQTVENNIDPSESTPVPIILRGMVIPEKVSCRYGPGAMYLYLYGLVKGAVQDVIGRTDSGSWVLTRSHGATNTCWVKTDLLEINGDVMNLDMVYPEKFILIKSNQSYRKPWDVAAIRDGDKVTISWKSDPLRPGDEESPNSVLFVVETWICRSGQLVFTPVGSIVPLVEVIDEPGCQQPSHGRIYFSEKHGYTGPSEIPWP